MIVLVHNILPPYRVPLFSSIRAEYGDGFAVLLSRENHPRRSWTVPSVDVDFPVRYLPGWHFDRPTRSIDISWGVPAELRALQPTVVVVAGWDLVSCWRALSWCRENAVPVLAWVESWAHSGRRRGFLTTRLRRSFLRRCSGVIVPGQRAAEFVKKLAPELPIALMPNSIVAHELQALPPASSGPALFMGDLSERKGFDLVLAAADTILDLCGGLIVCGRGELWGEVVRLQRADPRVEWRGFCEGPERIAAISSSSVFLLPSRRDPWPLVSAEALMAGRPIVLGPGVGSGPDLSSFGACVAVMEQSSSEELGRALALVLGQPVPAEARRRFTPEACAKAFVAAVDRARR